MNTYVVQSGDTLYGIAKRFNTSVQRIQELNNLKSTVLTPGDKLIIYEMSDNSPTECISYTVKKGDSLYSIARVYDTTVDEIKRYNNLTSNDLSIGQRITIPCYNEKIDSSVKPNYISYTVKKGDTLYSIAKEYGTDVQRIKQDNNITGNTLTVGSIILILDNLGVSTFEECYGEDFMSNIDYDIYIVKKGDSLYNIAKKFNTTVSEIKSLNMTSGDSLSIGQELKIPKSSSNESTSSYTVLKGDSLYSIANKFGTSVSKIKSLNNLTSDSLSIGQVLKIPMQSESSDTYTVQSGESLYSIAKKFNTTVDELKRKNNLTSNLIGVGDVLKI